MSENNNNIKFQFTRHALSCNNVDLGSNIKGKDFEPSITDHALMQLTKEPSGNYLRHNNSDVISNDGDDKLHEFNFERFSQGSNDLYILVSPLIRTWETAVVLYSIGNPEWKTMNLYIGPHLKEFVKIELGITLKTGNFYKSPEKIIPKFKNFLQILLKNNHESMINSNGKEIILHWPLFKGFDVKNPEFVKFTFIINGKSVDVLSECDNNDNNDLTKYGNYYVNHDDKKNDTNGFFKFNGNLQKFMELFQDKNNYNDNGYPSELIINNTVHVVTHSNVMQDYIKQIYGFDMKKTIPDKLPSNLDPQSTDPNELLNIQKIYLIKNSNNWTFTESYKEGNEGNKNEGELISHLNMQLGVPNEEIETNEIKHGVFSFSKNKKTTIKDIVKNKYSDKNKRNLCGSAEKIDKKMTCNGEKNKMTTNLKNLISKQNTNKDGPAPENGENTIPSGGKRKSRKYKKSKKNKRKSNTRKNKKH